MTESETGQQAATLFGDKLYQQRARAALPILVRQAQAQQTIYYSDLARELEMPNPRNLNFVLGSIGQTLINLGQKWNQEVPPIQFLVVNRANGLPGEGVGFFMGDAYRTMSKRQRRLLVEGQLQRIFAFNRWHEVLSAFSMQPALRDFSSDVTNAIHSVGGGGESIEHQLLKRFIADHPEVVGLRSTLAPGKIEHPLPSGDKLDVLFCDGSDWIPVEVKSRISNDCDLVRGMFQCVKYRAVMEAFLITTARTPNVRTLLVIARPLPTHLLPLKNILGVEVIEVIEPVPSKLTV